MSGPKVFHVVTREELVARCEAHLRRLDSAIAEWTKVCGRSGAADAKAAEAIVERREALRRMLKEDRFADIQKQVPAEISFLRSDAQSRVERAAAAVAQAMQNRRRTARTAGMLLEALGKSGRAIPEDLRRDLESSEIAESAIARAFALLSPAGASGAATDRQRELASELGRDEKRTTLSEWLASQPTTADRESDLRIDRHLAELAALGVDPSPFAAQAAAIAGEATPRQALLADSLLVELARAVKEGRERSVQLAELREHAAELSRHDSAGARTLCARIENALVTEDVSSAPALAAEAAALIQEEMRALAADARRRAVLQGLASLGYEVNEGMATAWVQGGQVVLRKASNPDYGVELGGGTKSDRLQVRAVAFGNALSPRNPSRDRDMETVWCTEFERLRTLVSASGGGIEIEHAYPVGATPLKLVQDQTRRDGTDEVTAPRTLQR
jgi:hypothetical protein